ncbi:MAG: methyl-accepting chemotaxis protein [Caulobacteraceae bacterium]|nr:methyl-accepting chemotaxis protein [Caulobacteraceae bacterium]
MAQDEVLDERLNFIRLDAEAQARIRAVKPMIMRELPAVLDAFYDQVRAFPQTRAFFPDPARMAAAKDRQLAHWERVSSGQFDQAYLSAVTKVGQTHARVGLEPRWYIGGYALMLEALVGAVLEARWPKGGFGAKGPGVKQVAAELGAVVKATLLDMDLSISVYLEASESARKAAEERAKATSAAVIDAIGDALSALAEGDLTHRIGDELPDEYGRLRDDFNAALARMAGTVAVIQSSAGGINASTDEISQASDDLSRRTEHQAASLEETAAALDEITATVRQTADGARQANDAVHAASGAARRSHEVVTKAVAAMGEIEHSSQQITQIIGVIDEIAFQTNLLALNAGVEAARAGDAGRGFAVVAQEVRALAQRSADAAKQIKTLISTSSQHVNQGVSLVRETGEALESIVASVDQIDGLVSEIAASANEQSSGLGEVNVAINQMDQVVQQNAAMVEQSTAAAHSLKADTNDLARAVSVFRIDDEHPAAVRAPRPVDAAARPVRSPVHAMNRKLSASLGARPASASAGRGREEF